MPQEGLMGHTSQFPPAKLFYFDLIKGEVKPGAIGLGNVWQPMAVERDWHQEICLSREGDFSLFLKSL